jgi:molybdopterin-guanine dinucleotide biosynthesis protein A
MREDLRTENIVMDWREGGSLVRGYVLAGGGSTRFGQDKALAEIEGRPMLTRMCEVLAGVASKVQVVAAPNKYARLGIESVADRWPGEGPLGGIITALRHSEAGDPQCQWNLMVSCDMPFLTREWIAFLAQRASKSEAQVVLPRSQHGLEPLCACYKTNAGGTLQTVFEAGVRKVTQALQQVKTEVLDASDWKRFDSDGRLFWNMNTPVEYDEAKRILKAEPT